jgi:hypothetical protein
LAFTHRAGRQRVEALGHAARVVHHFAGRQHRVGDAALHRLLGGEGVAQQQLFGRPRVAHQLRHDQAGAEFRHQAQAHEGHGQARFVGHVDEVAMQQHRGADADGRTGDGRHHGLVAFQQRAHEAEHRRVHAVAALAGRARHEVLDVVAAGEDTGLAGDQHRAHRGVFRAATSASAMAWYMATVSAFFFSGRAISIVPRPGGGGLDAHGGPCCVCLSHRLQ